MHKTPGEVIAAQRKTFSLSKLEEITDKNRSSILRYQRNEARIPEVVAGKLARAFFQKKKDIEIFLKLCQNEYHLTEGKIRDAKRRRAELSRASRQFGCKIIVSQSPVEESMEFALGHATFASSKDKKIGKVRFMAAIILKRSGDLICSLAPNEGLTLYPSSEWEKTGAVSIKDFVMFQSRKRPSIGRYALLDLMKKTVEASDIFRIGNDAKKLQEKFAIVSIKDLNNEEDRLKYVRDNFDSEDGEDIQDAIDTTIAHIQFWKDHSNDPVAAKKVLLKEIQTLNRKMDSLGNQ